METLLLRGTHTKVIRENMRVRESIQPGIETAERCGRPPPDSQHDPIEPSANWVSSVRREYEFPVIREKRQKRRRRARSNPDFHILEILKKIAQSLFGETMEV